MKKKATKAPHNEWNVPDWRDEKQYPIPLPEDDTSDLNQWRWEFLRRDREYRADWLRIRARDPEGRLALFDDPQCYDYSLEFPLLVNEQFKDRLYFQKKYKLKKLLNPAHRKPRHLTFSPFPSNSVTMKFDLGQALGHQLLRAKMVLEKAQKDSTGVILRTTIPEKLKWPRFLRAIDAEDDGLSLSEIGYQICGLQREQRDDSGLKIGGYDPNQAKSNAHSFLDTARAFWKKLPIPLKKS